jgi:hypothetical protein
MLAVEVSAGTIEYQEVGPAVVLARGLTMESHLCEFIDEEPAPRMPVS